MLLLLPPLIISLSEDLSHPVSKSLLLVFQLGDPIWKSSVILLARLLEREINHIVSKQYTKVPVVVEWVV